MKKITALVLSAMMLISLLPTVSMAGETIENGTYTFDASKTAQWTANGKGDDEKNYDLLISYYSANYCQTAYMGFDLPDDFNPEFVQSAKLKIYSNKLKTATTASVYGAEYEDFENNGLYTTSENAPSYNSTAISSITPASAGETAECDVTEYLKTVQGDVAFRIACASKLYTDWYIGSCNNGLTPPQLEIEYDSGEGSHTVPEKLEYENGIITFDKAGSFETGEEITLTVVPDEHYVFESLTIGEEDVEVSEDNTYTFSMPSRNISENYIRATFVLADYIKTRNIYEDNMLLQRNKPVYIDGVCENIGSATAYLYKDDEQIQEKSVTIENNEWNVTFDAVSDYTATYKIVISGDNGNCEMNNILFGDVYLFTGQSNMWKEVSYYKNTDSDYTKENVEKHLTDKIRVMYTKGSSCYGETNPTYDAAHKDSWRDFSSYSNVSPLPAVVFAAATKLYEETDVPIGVIANAYPGSYISCWFPNTGIDACNSNRNKSFNERNWYNGRIYPIRNLSLSGIFWYQGESDSATTYHSPQYDYYKEMMTKLINDWRELFRDEALPFYYVQLCRLGDTTDENNPDSTANGEVFIKQAQTDVYLEAEDRTNLGVVGTLDIYGKYEYPETTNDANCRNDIHPGQKRLVGERLAAFALKDIYNKDVYTSGPMFKKAEVSAGKIIVTYDCNGSLKIMESSQYADVVTDEKIANNEINPGILNEFEIAGKDGVWHSATAEITAHNQVTVYSDEVSEPTDVRYAYSAYPDAPNLTDDSNLPSYVFMQSAVESEICDKCVKITADYNGDGTLEKVKFEKISVSDIEDVQSNSLTKVFYWESLENMKPLTKMRVETEIDYDYSFVFGDVVSDKDMQMCADTVYAEQENGLTYGIVGVEDAIVEDSRFDGFKADYVASVLKDNTNSIEADYEACSDEIKEKMGDAEIPVRFAMKAKKDGYYTVTATVRNTSDTEEAEVSLYSELRHFILFHKKLMPGESITKTFNVRLAPTYVTGEGVREDDVINVCVTGRNAGLEAVKIKECDTIGRTVWTMTDSTGADQLSNVPYWMLENYGGTGQVLSKYINPEIAVSNQGEGGLAASDSVHFNNAVENMQAGDFMYVQYGFNDASPDVYKQNLEKYYTACHEKGVKLIIVSPTDRRNTSANWDSTNKVWTASNAKYAEAGRAFVEEKIAEGAEDIAFVDVNTAFVEWMNEAEQTILAQRQKLGFGDTEVSTRAMEYYFRCGWTFGTDSVHINDAGADRAGYIFAQQAKNVITDNSDSVQVKVLSELMENAENEVPVEISDEIVKNGWGPNDSYPKPLSDNVELEYPTMVKAVDAQNNKLNSMTVKVQGDMSKYALGVGEILDSGGNAVKTIYTTSTSTNEEIGHIDNTASKYGDIITMYFDSAQNDILVGGTYRVYLLPIENGASIPDSEPMYSSVYTQPSAVIAKLITSSDGNGSEMFNYSVDEGKSIKDQGSDSSSGAVKWQYAGSASSVALNKETKDNMTSVHLYSNGTGTYALTKFFNNYRTVSNGVVHVHFQINHEYGWYGIKLASTAKAGSWMDGIQILSMEDGILKLYDGTEAGAVKNGEWTDVDVWLDLDRCTETVSVAGGEKVSCQIAKLETSDKSAITSLLPLRGFTVIYTKYPSLSPSYAFDTYITDLAVDCIETETPKVNVNAVVSSECSEMGSISGMGEYDIHSDVTLKAIANEGYNFIGWYDSEGKLYSEEEEIVIERIREDIALTARFMIQRYKEDVVTFEIGTDKSAVKVGSSIKLSPINARDIDGNRVDEVAAADIEWSCASEGVSIDEQGVLTVSENFAIEENTTVDISVSGMINGYTVTSEVRVYSYAYYDAVSEKSAFDGEMMTLTDRTALVWPSGNNTSVYTLSEKVNLDKDTVISYKNIWSGSNTAGQYRHITFKDADGNTVITMYYCWTDLYASDDTKLGGAVSKNVWSEISVAIEKDTGVITVSNAEKSIQTTVDTSKLTDISTITVSSANGCPSPDLRPLGICDIIITQ